MSFLFEKCKENNINIRRTDDDPIYVDHSDADALHEIQDTRHSITEYTKK